MGSGNGISSGGGDRRPPISKVPPAGSSFMIVRRSAAAVARGNNAKNSWRIFKCYGLYHRFSSWVATARWSLAGGSSLMIGIELWSVVTCAGLNNARKLAALVYLRSPRLSFWQFSDGRGLLWRRLLTVVCHRQLEGPSGGCVLVGEGPRWPDESLKATEFVIFCFFHCSGRPLPDAFSAAVGFADDSYWLCLGRGVRLC